jgi:hypothetical protein
MKFFSNFSKGLAEVYKEKSERRRDAGLYIAGCGFVAVCLGVKDNNIPVIVGGFAAIYIGVSIMRNSNEKDVINKEVISLDIDNLDEELRRLIDEEGGTNGYQEP